MSKWAFGLAAGIIVLAGCAGGGGSSSGGGNGGNNGGGAGDSTAFVTIPNVPGKLSMVYLSGQGRAAGDLTAVIRRIVVDDQFGSIEPPIPQAINILLNGYSMNAINANVPVSSVRMFDHFNLEIDKLVEDLGGGQTTEYTAQNQALISEVFNANFKVFPGRTTTLNIRLNDGQFVFDQNGVTFDRNQFEVENYDPETNAMEGRFGDFLMFDISNLPEADRPDLPDGSGAAGIVLASGDNFAMGVRADGPQGNATPDAKPFFVLTRTGFVEGSHVGERTAFDPGTGQVSPLPGTFSLVQPDPRPPFDPDARISAMLGSYNFFTQKVAGLGNGTSGFEMIAFPNNRDDGVDDVIAMNTNASGQITQMYFGFMDLNAGTVNLFPINQLDTPENVNNEVTGSVANFLTGNGGSTSDPSQVRSGRFALDANNRPAGFPASGRFIVYRR